MSETNNPDHDPTRERILHGRLPWVVFRFGAPLALAMVLQSTFNLIDQYVIASLPRVVSDASLDALGICDMVAAVGTIMSYGVSTATATIVAKHRGANEDNEVARVAWSSVGMVLLLGLAFGLVGVLGADVIVHNILGAKGLVRELAASYMRVIVGGSASVFLMFQLTTLQRSLGDSKWPLAVMAVGNVLNLFLAVLLVYGPGDAPRIFSWGPPIAQALGVPRMEVVGAAWATVIARVVVCVIPLLILRRQLQVRKNSISIWPTREQWRAVIHLALPTSAQFVLRVASVLLVIGLLHHAYTSQENSTAGTAYALCLRFETMALFISMGWGGCAQTFAGMCIGAGDLTRAARAGWMTAVYNMATMAVLAWLFVHYGSWVVRIFSSAPEVLSISGSYLAIVAPSYLGYGLAIVLGNTIVGAGATRLALRTDAVLVLLTALPFLVIAVAVVGVQLNNFWRCIALVNIINAMVYMVVFRKTALWQSAPR
jgi:putative MATE family efflux protein